MASKCAWSHTQAYHDMFPRPRPLGHRSISVHHFVWGRAVYSAWLRPVRQVLTASEMDESATI